MEREKLPNYSKNLHNIKTRFPNLSVLKHLLTIESIRNYPKLALLVYSALQEYIEIFNNKFVSFVELLQKNKLISSDLQQGENSKTKDQILKKIKLCDGASAGREVILNFYMNNYKRNLQNTLKQPPPMVQNMSP